VQRLYIAHFHKKEVRVCYRAKTRDYLPAGTLNVYEMEKGVFMGGCEVGEIHPGGDIDAFTGETMSVSHDSRIDSSREGKKELLCISSMIHNHGTEAAYFIVMLKIGVARLVSCSTSNIATVRGEYIEFHFMLNVKIKHDFACEVVLDH